MVRAQQSMSKGEQHSVHKLVKINYLPRIVGYFLIGIIYSSHFYETASVAIWIGIVAQALLWPHAAYLIGKFGNSTKTEIVNFRIEAFSGGIWMVLLSFSLWPISVIIIAGIVNNIATGGIRLLGNILFYAFGGVLLAGLIHGFSFDPSSGQVTSFASMLFILTYMSLVVMQSYRNAKLLARSKTNLEAANIEVKEKYNTVQVELAERAKIEKELLRVNDDLQRFAYSVSHDLKTPLRGMAALTYFIEEDLSEDSKIRTKENFDTLRGRVQRLERLITGILEYTRIDQKRTDQQILVEEQVDEVLKELSVPAHFVVSKDQNLPSIYFNKEQLKVVFYNLICNAIKYNDKQQGTIHIGYSDREVSHEFSVRDNGEGIEQRFYTRVFEIFKKLHSGDEIEGSGIGLSIVKKIVNQYGGEIWIDSTLGQGTEFFFTLPKKINE